jgi:hypothetical protein
MPIGINGSGTITGLSAGGLPDASITADDIASGAIVPAKISTGGPSWDGSGNLSFNSGYGSAAVAYACRAWVNFNGTGTVAIRASGNVSSITDNNTGSYTVNMTNAMPDANYTVTGSYRSNVGVSGPIGIKIHDNATPTTTAFRFETAQRSNDADYDPTYVMIAVFR